MYIRIIAALISLLCLLFSVPCSAYAQAADDQLSLLNYSDSGLLSKPPLSKKDSAVGSTTSQTVYSLAELEAWIKAHKNSGGTVQLGQDLVVEEGESWSHIGWYGDPVMTVDTGPYCIRIRGQAQLFEYLEFTGQGGENGVLRVERGGLLECHTSVTASHGIAIYQEEGSILDLNWDYVRPEEKIHLAEKPVVWPANDLLKYFPNIKQPSVTLPYGEPLDPTLLPDTFPGCVYEDGQSDYELHDIPVEWKISEYEEEWKDQKRFLLEGQFLGDVEVYPEPPKLLVTFLRENAAVFLQCAAQIRPNKLTLTVYYLLDEPGGEHHLEFSYDGEIWETAREDSEHCQIINLDDGERLGLQVIWYHMDQLPRYFSIAVTGQDGRTRYSDTIEVTEQEQIVGSDIGGGRNGETSPLPPPSLGDSSDSSGSVSEVLEGENLLTPSDGLQEEQPSSKPSPNAPKDPTVNPRSGKPASAPPFSETSQTASAPEQEATVSVPPASAPEAPDSFQEAPSNNPEASEALSHVNSSETTIGSKVQIILGWMALFLLGIPFYLIPRLHKKRSLHSDSKNDAFK